MVNNFDKVIPFLEFDDKDDFYYLQILQRKKENPELGSNSRVIKNYYITSVEQLESHKREIIQLCKSFNARASLRLNRRNFRNVAFKAMVNMANSMNNQEYSFIRKSYDRAVGNGHAEPKGKQAWILDLDGNFEYEQLFTIESLVNNALPEGKNTICYIPSKSGLHLITKPFDPRELKKVYPEIDIHKDNPTNLYIA